MSSRVGNFSSSEIYRLMSKGRGNWSLENTGAAFASYVKEKRWERRMGTSLSTSVNARPTIWGTYMEKKAFDGLPFDYKLVSQERFKHQEIDCWTGAPDYFKGDVVGDLKSPWTRNSFCELVDIIETQDPEELKANKPMYYWQLISNAILSERKQCELKVFMPTKQRLEKIREEIENEDFHEGDVFGGKLSPDKVAFIALANIQELPYLPEDSKYDSMYTLTFTPPHDDLELLTARLTMAQKQLLK